MSDAKPKNRQIIAMATHHLKNHLARISQVRPEQVKVLVRNVNELDIITGRIIHDPTGAMSKWEKRLSEIIIVRSNEPLIRGSSVAGIYINSVVSIRTTRVAASRLADLSSAVSFLSYASSLESRGLKCMDMAKQPVFRFHVTA